MFKCFRLIAFLVAFSLCCLMVTPSFANASEAVSYDYEVSHLGLYDYYNSTGSTLNITRCKEFPRLLYDAYFYDLVLVVAVSEELLAGYFWNADCSLSYGVFDNAYGVVNASLLHSYPASSLSLVEENSFYLYFNKAVCEVREDFTLSYYAAVDWDSAFASAGNIYESMPCFIKDSKDVTWSYSSLADFYFRLFEEYSAFDWYSCNDSYQVNWREASFEPSAPSEPSPTDPTSPTDPSEPSGTNPPSPSIPENKFPGPRGAQTPVWVKKLDVLTMPNFQVGSDPVTFEAQAYTNDGGTIFYKWRLSGQKWNDGGFIPGSETEYTPSSNGTKFQVPLTEEGLYSLTCIAYNVFYDEVSGIEFTSQVTTCSITFTVTERESDPVPDTIKPPYEGWEDDMVNAQGLNKEIQNSTDNIDDVIDITDSIVTPNIDNINLDLGSLIDPVGFAAFGTILGLYWENNIVMLVITIAFVLAMIGFYLFGKR